MRCSALDERFGKRSELSRAKKLTCKKANEIKEDVEKKISSVFTDLVWDGRHPTSFFFSFLARVLSLHFLTGFSVSTEVVEAKVEVDRAVFDEGPTMRCTGSFLPQTKTFPSSSAAKVKSMPMAIPLIFRSFNDIIIDGC